MKKVQQDGFGAIEGLLILVVLLLIGFIGYYVYNTKKDVDKNLTSANESIEQQATTKSKQADVYEKWQTFASKDQGISLKYPQGWEEQAGDFYGQTLTMNFKSPDLKEVQLDNGYRIDAGGKFYLWVSPLDAKNIDQADKEAAQEYLGKSTIDSTADYIKIVQGDSGADYTTYTTPEMVDGMSAGRGTCGHYTHGPCVFWVKNAKLYKVVYDGPSEGFAVKPDANSINKYAPEFELMLKSIKLN